MAASIRLSARSARALRDLVAHAHHLGAGLDGQLEKRASTEINYALAKLSRARPRKASAQKAKTAKRKTKREKTADVREAVMVRAGDTCECGCGWPFAGQFGAAAQLDHFQGRARSESVETCWALRANCHLSKTNSVPSAAEWLGRFISHCQRHGYDAEAKRARARLHFVEARAVAPFGGAP